VLEVLEELAFVGTDTPLGPIYLGYGVAEGGNEVLYFFIGQSF
jgi:NTE family protein